MRAIDTNVVVRLLERDDAGQLAVARELTFHPFLLLPTVILESIWVLQSRYRLERNEIAARLERLLGHAHARIASIDAVAWAFEAYKQGHDFADALHIALAAEADAESFASFDKNVQRIAGAPVRLEGLKAE